MAAILMALAANAQGITSVGANIPILKSARWSSEPYKAKVLVANPNWNYSDFGEWNDKNDMYNVLVLEDGPAMDANGHAWYEKEYDESTPTADDYGVTEDGFFHWEEQQAPFSSDETWNGMKSFRWTTDSHIADIYFRRTFTTDNMLSGDVYLACGHDDAPAEYYINGVLVWQATGYDIDHHDYVIDEETGDTLSEIPRYKNGWNIHEVYKLTDEQKDLIRVGGEENVIAVHVHQNWGGAFADCGLYTLQEGGLEMGYVKPWDGKVIFNSHGGYGSDKYKWEKLYEAQEGDVYAFRMEGSSEQDAWGSQMHFKTPITFNDGEIYTVKFKLNSTGNYSAVRVKICDNDNDEVEATAFDGYTGIEAGTETEFEEEVEGLDAIKNMKLVFDFAGGEGNDSIKISEMSIKDEDGNELWIGTHYFNFFYMTKSTYDEETDETTFEELKWPDVEGRVETLAWTLPDFDDEQWDTWEMPCGSAGYMPEMKTVWPGGNNTNLWVRRDFELDKVNPRLSYALNVCHDDAYMTYVNGHLLQIDMEQYAGHNPWTDGKNPVQVHIPAKYLNVGKNVIATYIQQNWGGFFYDCGINVEEVNYQECADALKAAIAYAETEMVLTKKMKENVQALIEDAKHELETNMDAAEVKNYAKVLIDEVNTIFSYSADVKIFKETYEICSKMEDKGYWGNALTDAAVALDTCATANELNKYLNPMREARKATAMERHYEKYIGSAPEIVAEDLIGDWDGTAPKYYIFNVGAKLFLSGGESWGAHLVLDYASNPMMLVQAMKDIVDEDGNVTGQELAEGAFLVETFRPNGAIGEMDFMAWNGYIDCPPNSAWELIPVEGKEKVYNIAQYGQTFTEGGKTYNGTEFEAGGKKLLGLRSGDNAYSPSYYVVDTDMHSPELETNQWMFISRQELLSLIETATEDNPVDLSFLISNPGYDQRLSIDDWVFYNGSVLGRGGDHPNFVLESYNTEEFSNYQELLPEEEGNALPAGTYKLMVQGYYRDGMEQAHVEKIVNGEPISLRANLFVGADATELETCTTMSLMAIHKEANKVPGIGYTYADMTMPGTYNGQPMSAVDQAAREYFPSGLYWNEVAFTIHENTDEIGHLVIGVDKAFDPELSGMGDWIVMDNWRLKYLGNSVDPQVIIDGISDVITSPVKVVRDIYNLSGQKLMKAQKGVNIVNGKKVLK